MSKLGLVDIAFLPDNFSFTMSPAMLRNAVELVEPRILYPYHTGNTEKNTLLQVLSNIEGLDIKWGKN